MDLKSVTKKLLYAGAFALLLYFVLTRIGGAAEIPAASPPPPSLTSLLATPPSGTDQPVNPVQDEASAASAIRADALREASLSFGARAGLANRTFEIQRRLAEKESYLSKTYAFARLLIPAQDGLLIEPPIVSEAQQALLIKTGGQEAATADRVLKINRAARIVSAPRDWRTYLERDWGTVDPPPGVLQPRDEAEKRVWDENLKKGWQAGVEQADEIFQADLDRLTNDFVGMVRYRELLQQGVITAPYALAENRGVTGNPNELRIGDRGLEITGPAQFVVPAETWEPATR